MGFILSPQDLLNAKQTLCYGATSPDLMTRRGGMWIEDVSGRGMKLKNGLEV